jgi:hypothetical protein
MRGPRARGKGGPGSCDDPHGDGSGERRVGTRTVAARPRTHHLRLAGRPAMRSRSTPGSQPARGADRSPSPPRARRPRARAPTAHRRPPTDAGPGCRRRVQWLQTPAARPPAVGTRGRTHGSGGPMTDRRSPLPLRTAPAPSPRRRHRQGTERPCPKEGGTPVPPRRAHTRVRSAHPMRPWTRAGVDAARREARQIREGPSSKGCWTWSSPSTSTMVGSIRRVSTSPSCAARRTASAVG